MHGADEVTHLVDRLSTGLDHDVDSVTEHLQLGVGDEHSNSTRASAVRSSPVISQSTQTSSSLTAILYGS